MAGLSPNPDPQWLDSMYNNRVLVPDHGDYFARWDAQSKNARAQLSCKLDLAYGDGALDKLDVFTAHGVDAKAPVMVFIHGGWWRSLTKSDHSMVAPEFAKNGACVVMPDYDLCPAVTIPDITMQMVKALAWTYRNIARFGGDPNRITLVGHSAGGHLSAMLMACVWPAYGKDLPADLVKNALAISGLYELDVIRQTPFLQESLRLTPEQVNKASPARLPAPKRGTVYTVAGASESAEFMRQNTLLQKAWGSKRVPVCEAQLGLNHFSIVDALVTPGHRVNQFAKTLLNATA